ncbi:MAG: flagellar biosynthetic protein FliR [Candidatus Eremiobacteraeota bacterium]|nr:flagellar biosynthetic protein FliR [Candidatus Eremiobacteraeota bacterium]
MSALLVFARCIGFAFRAPGFSHPSVTPSVRAGLALFLTLCIAPSARAGPLSNDAVALLFAFVTEFLLGAAIGMAASVVYDAAYAGGRAVDDYVGVKAIAPSLQLVAPSGFGRVWSLAYTGGFFLSGADRITVAAFAQSFARIAPGSAAGTHDWAAYVAGMLTTIVTVALMVAGPALGLAFVVQLAVGALSRAVPRFGSFTLAFPLAFAAAVIATALAVPSLARHAAVPVLAIPWAMP